MTLAKGSARARELDRLLEHAIGSFDIPPDLYQRAVRRYESVARWLERHWAASSTSGVIYPQGSIRLGTVVRPLTGKGEFDVDLVARRDYVKTSITQLFLKTDTGRGLRTFVQSSPDGAPVLCDGKRCWTLDYVGEPFHIDILPAIPDAERGGNFILLTDRDLREWQVSNPIDFSTWFRGRMASEFLRSLERVAALKAMEIEKVPEWEIRTTLQRAVQALKRHRDIYFLDRPELRPASIIITSLAASAYQGQDDLVDTLIEVTGAMPNLVERRNGVYWIANPVHHDENFADRWRHDAERAAAFFEWMEQAAQDFRAFGDVMGTDHALKGLERSFGSGPAEEAQRSLGQGLLSDRNTGRLTLAAGSGTLGIGRGHVVPRHTNHGDPRP